MKKQKQKLIGSHWTKCMFIPQCTVSTLELENTCQNPKVMPCPTYSILTILSATHNSLCSPWSFILDISDFQPGLKDRWWKQLHHSLRLEKRCIFVFLASTTPVRSRTVEGNPWHSTKLKRGELVERRPTDSAPEHKHSRTAEGGMRLLKGAPPSSPISHCDLPCNAQTPARHTRHKPHLTPLFSEHLRAMPFLK